MHIFLTQRTLSGLIMLLSRHSVGTYPKTSSHATCWGNIRPQSSQLAGPLLTDPGIKKGISVRELISTLKKKNPGREWVVKHSPHHYHYVRSLKVLMALSWRSVDSLGGGGGGGGREGLHCWCFLVLCLHVWNQWKCMDIISIAILY